MPSRPRPIKARKCKPLPPLPCNAVAERSWGYARLWCESLEVPVEEFRQTVNDVAAEIFGVDAKGRPVEFEAWGPQRRAKAIDHALVRLMSTVGAEDYLRFMRARHRVWQAMKKA